VFVAGTARSGGVWVSDILDRHDEYRLVFEPFHPKRAPWMARYGGRIYLRPAERHEQFRELARSIVTGRIRHPWTERLNRRFVARQRIIKADFANLMMKWLYVTFPGMPLVLILRHPCAVALSFVARGYRGAVEPLLDRETLVEDFLHPYADAIRGARDTFERTLFLWCVETLVPLRQFRPGEVHVTFFENLVRHPESEFARLFAHVGMGMDGFDLDKLRALSPTFQRAGSARRTGADPVDGWRGQVGLAQRRRALEILSLFGLDGISSDAPMPRTEGVFEVMTAEPRAAPARGAAR